MKPGDIVRIAGDHHHLGGKIAIIIGTDVSSFYDPIYLRVREEIRFEILIDGKIKRGVAPKWLKVIDENR